MEGNGKSNTGFWKAWQCSMRRWPGRRPRCPALSRRASHRTP